MSAALPAHAPPGHAPGHAMTSMPMSGSPFIRRWASVTLVGAVVITAVDAALLQRSKNFFTGGFLTVQYLRGPAETAAFLLVSYVSDAAVLGLLAAVVMWVLGRTRVRASACAIAGLLAGLGSLLLADVLSYELVRYLGDALDLSLMFDLTGRSIGEFFAVASSHLLLPALLIVAAGGAAAGVVWVVHRRSKNERLHTRARALVLPLLAAVGGLLIVTSANAYDETIEDGALRKPSGRLLATVANVLTDVDGDGFGIGGRQTDPDLFNASVFPYAVDAPGNGIDEDGVGGDLPADTPPYTEPPVSSAPWTQHPDVLLVVLESFRADVAGARVNDRPVTPVLDALAGRGVSSLHAYSHNGYTAQSRYHIFSGSLAGVRDRRTLVDDFKQQGYHTGYFSGQDESFGGRAYAVGADRADVTFDARQDREHRYSTFSTAGSLAVPLSIVQQRVYSFLQTDGKDQRPLFVYVNFHDTHFPYSHDDIHTITSPVRLERGEIAPERRDALWATYTNTAANVDRAIGEVVDAVQRARGRMPAVIVTADHGESLFDEGFLGHGYALNDVQTRIPFVAANLPLVVTEPFGEDDLRDAIDRALRTSPDVAERPRIEERSDQEVFQYLGTIDRPRQIAFLTARGRTIYDFRSRQFQAASGAWRQPQELTGTDRDAFLSLVHRWERMVLARRGRAQHES